MNKRGIALISVLIVSSAILAILAAGIRIGTSGVLHVSVAHRRNVALSAAEAGVYQAMSELEQDKNFEGEGEGTLGASGARYRFTVTNEIWGGGSATVVSTGSLGPVNRTLRVRLEPDTEGFDGLSLGGKVYAYDRAYINGISSASNPLYRPGNAHSEHSSGEDAFVGGDFDGDGEAATLRATGDVTTAGTIDSTDLDLIARQAEELVSQNGYRLDKDQMLSGNFPSATTVPSDGKFTGNARFSGDVTFPMKVTIEEGATVHIQGGSATFLAGVEGEGSLVVDGDVVIQTRAEFHSEYKEGITVLADGSISLAHPEAEASDSGLSYEMDAVGDYFAQMPSKSPSQIANGIPADAPRDGDFFLWLDTELSSGGDSEFLLWYQGDGSEAHPGLSTDTRAWLENSRPIKEDIKAWADSASTN